MYLREFVPCMTGGNETLAVMRPTPAGLPLCPSSAAGSVLFLLTVIVGVAVLFGIGFCLGGFAKAILNVPHVLLVTGLAIEGAIWYATWVIFRRKFTPSSGHFVVFIALLWLLTRGVIILAFPNATLIGDETYLHRFVIALADGGVGRENLSALSSWYDYPIWLSRAFPFYLPLRILFGSADLIAVRVLNAVLGAATIVLIYFISKRLIGPSYGRLTAWIMLIWPYHVAGVLSYDPQIPGTFFFVLGVWLALDFVYSSSLSISSKTVFRAILLGLNLWLAEVQRGGIDALLFVTIIASGCIYSLIRRRCLPCRAFAALVALTFICWMPPRIAFDRWIAINDSQHLRSQLLGFMTRGWNLASMGEYLPRYEQLDAALPTNAKKRVLESVLLTEIVRRPLDTLAIVPLAKMAKFLALGYSASTETELETGGYPRSAAIFKALRVSSALVLLLLCTLGLAQILEKAFLRALFTLPLMLTALSIVAITLIWETMSRYSHPLHFAISMLAAIGFLSFRKKFPARNLIAQLLNRRVVISVAGIVAGWVLCWSTAFAAGSLAKSYHFVDLRRLQVNLDGTLIPVFPLNGRTVAWEDVIEIPATTTLPADIHLLLPKPAIPLQSDQFSFSIWIPDEAPQECPSCKLQVSGPGAQSQVSSFKNLRRMKRLTLTAMPLNNGSRMIQLRILGNSIQVDRSGAPLFLAIGYVLPE